MFGPSKRRIYLTRIVALILVAIQLVTTHSWSDDGVFALMIESMGASLIGIAAIGRAWCALFISGHKTHDLVTVGPYSIVRNPLYLFSFIGAIGIGFASENLLLLALLLLLFGLYYPVVIKREEVRLHQVHGAGFSDYLRRVPRFFPNLSLYTCPALYQFDTRRVFRALGDCLVFLCIYPGFEIIEHLRFEGYLPTLAQFPSSIYSALHSISLTFFITV